MLVYIDHTPTETQRSMRKHTGRAIEDRVTIKRINDDREDERREIYCKEPQPLIAVTSHFLP
jgi:hypothetical protein